MLSDEASGDPNRGLIPKERLYGRPGAIRSAAERIHGAFIGHGATIVGSFDDQIGEIEQMITEELEESC
jgi:hypothetical protein